jgi:hypothetical protein
MERDKEEARLIQQAEVILDPNEEAEMQEPGPKHATTTTKRMRLPNSKGFMKIDRVKRQNEGVYS